MTPLGTLIFSAIGVLFVAVVGGAIWWVMRADGAMLDALQRDGWTVERPPPGGNVKWRAQRLKAGITARIEVTVQGTHKRSAWTQVRLATDTGADDVLVERKMPGLLAADGALAGAVGFKPPPRWPGGQPAFAEDYNAYASSEAAALRWLSPANQSAIAEFNSIAPRQVAVRFYDGAVEARWAQEPQIAAQLDGVVALLERLRRRQ